MIRGLFLVAMLLLLCSTAFAITAVEGTIEKVDHAGKTMVVKAADGTEHTFHFVGRTTVHGAETGSKESFHGLKEGSTVVVHYSTKGTEETAEEVDHLGKGGLKAAEGTVTHLDRGAKTVTVKTAEPLLGARVGDWRLFCEADERQRIVFMTVADHRKEAYR